VLRGHVGSGFEHMIDGFEVVSCARGTTRLVGWVPDQAALQGAVRAVSDFGFELVSVHEVADS
jgi:hypothetical protein